MFYHIFCREEQLHEKIEERKVKEGIKIQEEIEKEARLEALRAQVSIIFFKDYIIFIDQKRPYLPIGCVFVLKSLYCKSYSNYIMV